MTSNISQYAWGKVSMIRWRKGTHFKWRWKEVAQIHYLVMRNLLSKSLSTKNYSQSTTLISLISSVSPHLLLPLSFPSLLSPHPYLKIFSRPEDVPTRLGSQQCGAIVNTKPRSRASSRHYQWCNHHSPEIDWPNPAPIYPSLIKSCQYDWQRSCCWYPPCTQLNKTVTSGVKPTQSRSELCLVSGLPDREQPRVTCVFQMKLCRIPKSSHSS